MPGLGSQHADGTGRAPADAAAGACTPDSEVQSELAGLIATIECEVIPRLLLMRRSPAAPPLAAAPPPTPPRARVHTQEVDALVSALLADRPVTPIVSALLRSDVDVDQLFVELLAPAARELGTRWSEDLASFADVTVAVGRLQQLLRELSYDFLGGARPPQPRRTILLAPCPGEQHLFGTLMVSEYFRRAGWDVTTLPAADIDELTATVRNDWFAVVGLSAGSTRQLDSLAAAIRATRRASVNRAVGVMAGGPAFANRPQLVARVGADAGAEEARQAPACAEQLLDLLAADCHV
ncbi:MAG: cobalamin B12-binding domain-containing protein [Pseudomonadota bacterium]